ncbi:sce7726 family protein [Elizabethkingia anophelis]|uniref:Sce7726 family protein n=1 Tax=Elizabethkingia anophelis R26 TaxID=1246994 RepID=A0ABM6MT16_9FLAO|nr:sce7726 family protein [Elizabethkingia anophelis]ATC36313.1 hypothetical protein BAZ09_008835 [Elizabethkingia anophelis R26]ATC39990.1 hypothetical protein EAAG1_009050 [Elizabethkingia anophelis Ag1]ATC43669.1 hypothetical protein CMV41_09050 [Elizabethkingia anophelis]ATC47345.1 hypothetical protein CMV40_09050 [Elizabethkingia anophelis]ELR80216.1 hypothetical protein D505_05854 [Elizabethkingia anophelis R26]
MLYQINQLRDFSSLFTRKEVKRWFKDDFKSIDLKLERYNLLEKNKGTSYLKFLKNTYKILEENYPNEYILKNEFLNKWLKKELGKNDSLIINEFRTGKAIADLVMFNGVSKAFEIKTILDKEYRLSSQLQEYKKIFNEVYIIIPKNQINKYINYDKYVGIISYDSEIKNFELIRRAITNNEIDSNSLIEILHTKEYLEIVYNYYGYLPDMTVFTQYEVCKQLLYNIPKGELNTLFLRIIKKRKVNNLFFNKINNEFNQICLSLNLNKSEKDKLIEKLKTNIN